MLFFLRPKGGDAPDAKAFARAFRRSLALQTIENVDHAVRHFIVEDRPTDVGAFRRKVETFRQLRDKVTECEAQLSGAELIQQQYEKAHLLHKRSVTWLGASALCAVDACLENLDQLTERQQLAEQALAERRERTKEFTDLVEQRDARWQEAWQKMLGHTEHTRRAELAVQIKHLQQRAAEAVGRLRAEFSPVAAVLREVQAINCIAPEHKAQAAVALNRMKATLEFEKAPQRDSILSLVDESAGVCSHVRGQVQIEILRLEQEAGGFGLQAQQLRLNAARAAQGKAPLSDKASALLALLRAEGMKVEPVCDLIRCKDTSWQPALEAYLGPNVEALLVAEQD